MNLVPELYAKLDMLARDGLDVSGFRSAVQHVEVAAHHLARGRTERDETAFTDVIYRTNSAFEGMLKEAYRLFKDAKADKLTPYEIERELETSGALSDRVLIAVRRYRQEWRNPSTHDHTLTFSDQDGLLAIMSVLTFAAVLLDQVAETASVKLEEAALRARSAALERARASYNDQPFHHQVATLLSVFGAQIDDDVAQITDQNELAEVVATFLSTTDPDLQAITDQRIGSYQVDVTVRKANNIAVIQLKRAGSRQFLRNVASELGALLAGAELRFGFVFVPPKCHDEMLEIEQHTYIMHGATVFIVFPFERGRPRAAGTG